MKVSALMKHLGGTNCSKIDNVFLISTTANFKVWVERGENFEINESDETLTYIDKSSGFKQVIDITDIDIVTLRTDESENNPIKKQVM